MACQMVPHKNIPKILNFRSDVKSISLICMEKTKMEGTQYDSLRETVDKNSLTEIIFQDL